MRIMVKVMLLGDTEVGKTALLRVLLNQAFPFSYLPTLGSDFAIITINIAGSACGLHIWDLAGQDRFAMVRRNYYAGCSGALAVFDVTRPNTLWNLTKWIQEFQSYSSRPNLPIVVVANKVDLHPAVLTEQQQAFISQLQKKKKETPIDFMETSARTGYNVLKAFELLSTMLVWNVQQRDLRFPQKIYPPSLFKFILNHQLELSSVKLLPTEFCPFCGAMNLIAGKTHTGQNEIHCLNCENKIS